ncbi:hypothetical protein RMCBS344292_05630 [Rhizopus microsporus]|nr:hypothetical protein RMCBS344292_05630 [Rhizopus microsporus]
MIKSGMRTADEENFQEALSHVWRLSSTNHIPSEVRQTFNDPSCVNADANSPYFWILAKAVRDFVENEGEGQLPLSGKLPDMKADTVKYIGLQRVYRQKALSDLNAVKKRVNDILDVFKAADRFQKIYHRYPSSVEDYDALKEQTVAFLESIDIPFEQIQELTESEVMDKTLQNL